MTEAERSNWLALAIGNSRLHWARFVGGSLVQVWDSPHVAIAVGEALPQEILPHDLSLLKAAAGATSGGTLSKHSHLPVYLASVVPQQTKFWLTYPHAQVITLDNLPLQGVYPTLGIDRALALWGAGVTYGFPCLVVDAGTALTFTGADDGKSLVGGAILPGLSLQLQTLAQKTATLPGIELPQNLPQRWARGTSEAIESGVIYTVLAGVQDFMQEWWRQYPDSQIVVTGGDAALLVSWLQVQYPEVARVKVDTKLIFWGMRSLVRQ